MSNLAVILARAGSKGLPDKCMRRVLGRSLIDYSLTHALTSTRLDAVVLSTDSAPAKQSAESRSVEVIDRPPQLADDMATIDAAARHAVEKWEHRHDQRVSNVVILYANIPVRAEGVIDRALERLISTGATSVRTVAPVGKHHPDWLFRLEGDRMVQLRPNSIHRRQDLEPVYYHDGAVIAVTRQALFAAAGSGDSQAFLGADRRALVQRCEDAVDVDEPMDLLLAEAVLRDHRSISGRVPAFERVAAAELPFVVKGSRPACSTFVVAEIGVNHDGQVGKAVQLVDSAIDAGADAVKLQVFSASELASSAAPLAEYQKAAGDDNQREMLRRLELSDGELQQIAQYCRERGIALLATPFSPRDVERVVRLGVVAIKIASTDLTNTPLLRTAAQTTLPLVVSTGAATREEILATSARLRAWRVADRLVLLHCVSRYPAPLSSINLRAIAS
ncbi:MAG: N-acetylneuraminate synthase family protein, partial [Planctomycetes bacterium]|nr:N-acetylneuraminate synthase family protein [Planctomycetota bacterium]